MVERLLAGLLVVPFLLGAAAAPAQHGDVVFRFQDPDIIESSALVSADGLVFTSNDSGDTGRVFAVDPKTGETVGVTHWEDDPTDVESLAPGADDTVWVGDIGDNFSTRSSVQVAEVPVGRGERTVHPTVYDLAYPDGAHDAETLVRDPATGRLYVASKDVLGGTLYELPGHLSASHANQLTPVGSVLPIATDGAFFPDGKHLIVRNYTAAAIYAFPSLDRVANLALPAQQQGEGISVDADNHVLLGSEGPHSPVLSFELPRRVRQLVSGLHPTPAPPPSAPPSDTAHPAVRPSGSPVERSSADRSGYWLLAGLVGVVAIGVIIGSLRRRRS